jgi:putative transposase
MKGSRFTEEQIIGILREQEAGARTEEVCRRHGISNATFYKWKAKYGGLEVSDARRLKALEDENRRLKRLRADSLLDNAALKDILGKTFEACGAASSSDAGNGASRAESAARVRASGVGPFDSALPLQATGRLGIEATIAGVGGGAAAFRVSALRQDVGARSSRAEP